MYHKVAQKKTIVHFLNRKHAKKALLSRKNLRNNSSPNCTVFINENLNLKNNKIAFLGRKSKHSGDLNKIYIDHGTVQVLRLYHINDLFPYYDIGENYRENYENDSLQYSY